MTQTHHDEDDCGEDQNRANGSFSIHSPSDKEADERDDSQQRERDAPMLEPLLVRERRT